MFYNMIKNNVNNKNIKGFTIMEIMVSIYIISIGLIGIYSLISQNIKVKYINSNTLIAVQLAQEGIELTRNIRDNNWLTMDISGNPIPYYSNIATQNGNKKFNINYDLTLTSGITNIDDAGCSLYINSSNGLYTSSSTAPNIKTMFNRMIETNNFDTSSSTEVISTIQWKDKGRKLTYTIKTILYDWR